MKSQKNASKHTRGPFVSIGNKMEKNAPDSGKITARSMVIHNASGVNGPLIE